MSSPVELDPIVLPLIDGTTILDVACGLGKWGYLLRSCWQCTKAGNNQKNRGDYSEPEYLVGVDIWSPSLKKVKYHRIYDEVILCSTLCLPFKKNCFDVVLAAEILEHIEKRDVDIIFKEIERVSKKTMIVTTPRDSKDRVGIQTQEGMNVYERHVSRVSVGELKLRKYSVIGCGLYLFAKHISFILKHFGILQIIHKFPHVAELLVAHKRKQ